MITQWQPYHEPIRNTLLRTGTIAIVVGGVVSAFRGGLARWPMHALLMLWPAFGGHWVEIWFLNWLRPRLSPERGVQVAARLVVWFAGGAILTMGMGMTARALSEFLPGRWPSWWLGGLGFIGIELVAHVGLALNGRHNFYDGRG